MIFIRLQYWWAKAFFLMASDLIPPQFEGSQSYLGKENCQHWIVLYVLCSHPWNAFSWHYHFFSLWSLTILTTHSISCNNRKIWLWRMLKQLRRDQIPVSWALHINSFVISRDWWWGFFKLHAAALPCCYWCWKAVVEAFKANGSGNLSAKLALPN